MNSLGVVSSIKLPLSSVEPLLCKKLRSYAEIFDDMDRNGGLLKYPDAVVNHLTELSALHWADLYFRDAAQKYRDENAAHITAYFDYISSELGSSPSIEDATAYCIEMLQAGEQAADDEANSISALLSFNGVDVSQLPPEERRVRCDAWLLFHLNFYNDLAIAAHGVSIFDLVAKASVGDEVALVKAIQIDKSLLGYFQDQYVRYSLKGKVDFFDLLSYRVKNSPRKGIIKHPFLWVLFKDLRAFGCLRRSVTSRQILDLYQGIFPDHPKYSIDDELTVQRQRRNFLRKYR